MAVPGDVVDVQIRSKRRRFMEGYIVNYVKNRRCARSLSRTLRHLRGCKWRHLPYSEQLRFKQQQVADQLGRIGKIRTAAVSPILGSAKTLFYRNKLEFLFSTNGG